MIVIPIQNIVPEGRYFLRSNLVVWFENCNSVLLMCAMRPVSDSVPKVADKTFKRKYIALGRIVTRWQDIIGDKMAALAQPQKIHYRKARKKGDKPTATLEIATSSTTASLLMMQKGMILEKINLIFGEDWVTDIKFVHMPVEAKKRSRLNQTKTLTTDEENSLSAMLNDIEDKELKIKLQNMGQSLLKDLKE